MRIVFLATAIHGDMIQKQVFDLQIDIHSLFKAS